MRIKPSLYADRWHEDAKRHRLRDRRSNHHFERDLRRVTA